MFQSPDCVIKPPSCHSCWSIRKSYRFIRTYLPSLGQRCFSSETIPSWTIQLLCPLQKHLKNPKCVPVHYSNLEWNSRRIHLKPPDISQICVDDGFSFQIPQIYATFSANLNSVFVYFPSVLDNCHSLNVFDTSSTLPHWQLKRLHIQQLQNPLFILVWPPALEFPPRNRFFVPFHKDAPLLFQNISSFVRRFSIEPHLFCFAPIQTSSTFHRPCTTPRFCIDNTMSI